MRSLKIRLLVLICFAHTASAQGVQFFEGTWSELLAAAKKQNKLIFVDVYTDWCPPCKQMDKEVFPLKEVGDKYNAQFLNYRLNAEKGDGVALAGSFDIKAYPTYLYLDAEGALLHRIVGFHAPASLADNANKAISSRSASTLEKTFKDGQRDPAFLRSYLQRMQELGMDNNAVLNAYVDVMPADQLATPEELLYLGEHIFNTRSNALVFLMAHYHTLPLEQKRKVAARIFSNVLHTAVGTTWQEGRPVELQQIIAYIDTLEADLPEQSQAGINKSRLLYFGMVKELDGLKQTGYKMAGKLMEIPLDSIRAEDKRQYEQVMKPYLTGQLDSTKVPGFREEQQYIVNLYSRNISSFLYDAATAFAASLAPGDPALQDALKWAERVKTLLPNPGVDKLVNKLQTLTK